MGEEDNMGNLSARFAHVGGKGLKACQSDIFTITPCGKYICIKFFVQ